MVKAVEDLLRGPREIQRVQVGARAFRKAGEHGTSRPQFERTPAPLSHLARQEPEHGGQVVRPIDERIAMI
jgi:hypothetical protein